MLNKLSHDTSLGEVHGTVDISQKKNGWKKVLAFFGPAYLVSVGYMDPGNWATDLAGGSRFGYALIWVLLMSNLMALLLQNMAARLGIVRGRDLAQVNRETYPRTINLLLYALAEIAIAATDLAEVLGMAIGIHLLTGLPLIWGVTITVFDTLLLLLLQHLGIRKMEAFIIGLVAIVGLSFLTEIFMARPQLGEVATGFIPTFPNDEALYIAIGIIGATVMPHNLYLHSALVQTRKIARTDVGIKQALKWNFADSAIALNLAFLVNTAILVLAATVFFKHGQTVAQIKNAYQLLPQFLGSKITSILFAVALIAAGQSSTITGTLSGQIVMEGYLKLRINPWMRRLLTRLLAIIPAILVISLFGDDKVDSLLVLSQVILSMQLGFAIIPLIHFVSDRKAMGSFAINNITRVLAWGVATVLVYLNIRMVITEAAIYFTSSSNIFWKLLIVASGAGYLALLGYIVFFPWLQRKKPPVSIHIHPEAVDLQRLPLPVYNKIAVALDFGRNDPQLLAHAIGQGRADTRYLLIHVVESVPATLFGKESDDYETRNDEERLQLYIDQLKQNGYEAMGRLGYKHRAKEIARLIREEKADMLVIGAHGHSGVKDWIYGETVNSVRHEVRIPVLVVHL